MKHFELHIQFTGTTTKTFSTIDVFILDSCWGLLRFHSLKNLACVLSSAVICTLHSHDKVQVYIVSVHGAYIALFPPLGVSKALCRPCCWAVQINGTSLIKSAWVRSGCHGNNYQSCLINFLNCLMIYDPLNSLIFFLSNPTCCVFIPPFSLPSVNPWPPR